MSEQAVPPRYPAQWEADVVLSDGAIAHLRPITPDDAQRLVEFYARVSDESKYLRFFAPYPVLTPADIDRFTRVDHHERAALVVLVGEEMLGVARYERPGADAPDAEVAFLIEDAHQGRGLGSILLEHLAQAARERGIRRFVAGVLPRNRTMVRVFKDAGYTATNTFEDGIVRVEISLHPTEVSLAVTAAREHRGEARSIQRLLTPRSVAVVGASRSRDNAGRALVRNLVLAGFTGPVYAVHPEARAVAGVPAYASVRDLPGPVDLAVVAVPADGVEQVVLDCATKGVHALVVVAAGYAETGDEAGLARQESLVRIALQHGMRVVGPNCLGLVNTDPDISLNACLASAVPPRGTVGVFAQSPAMGATVVAQVAQHGMGLSTFVSVGNRADVSGNDLLQYWQEDPATEVVLLYLESVGNPRKFGRLARQVARVKPVVAVRTGRLTRAVSSGHEVAASELPAAAVDALFAQAGVVLVDTLAEMVDVGQLLASQPLPAGPRVAVLASSIAAGVLAADALVGAGLRVVARSGELGPEAPAAAYASALADALGDPDVDAVLVVVAPALGGPEREDVAAVLAAGVAAGIKPVVATFLGVVGPAVVGPGAVGPGAVGAPTRQRRVDDDGVAARGSVPAYDSPEEAARAMGQVARYAAWRRGPTSPVPEPDGCDQRAARAVLAGLLAEHPAGARLVGHRDGPALAAFLAGYGIALLPTCAVADLDAAVAAAESYGWDVVLKATDPRLRHRPDLADVWRHIATVDDMRDAWRTLSTLVPDIDRAGFVVQPMAPAGVPVVVAARQDPAFGPVVSFGVSGIASDLLGDRTYRMPPLTVENAAEMVREIRAAPLLFGYRGAQAADTLALEELLHRVAQMADDLPDLAALELDPVLVAPRGLSVVNAAATVRPSTGRRGWYVRSLG